jgi:hypothetical protein
MRFGLVFALFAVALPVALASAACTSDDPAPAQSPGLDGGAETLDPAAATFIADLCGAYAKCCAGGAGDCTTTNETQARGLTFDAARASTCLEAVRARATSDAFCLQPPGTSACAAVFKLKTTSGSEPGRACAKSSECSSGDDGDGVCILQKCKRVKQGELNDNCIGTRIDGVVELTFGAVAHTGAVCAANEGFYCDEATKKCTPRAGVGTTCAGADISCVDEGWCPTTTKQCAPRTAFESNCEDEYECALGSRCANDGEGAGVCTPYEVAGGTCERGDECDARKGLVCDSETTKCVDDASVKDRACKGSIALLD